MKKTFLVTFILISILSCNNKDSQECIELIKANEVLSKNMDNYRTAWETAFENRDINSLDSYLHEEITHLNEDGDITSSGPEEFKNSYNGYIVGFPDSEFTILKLYGQGDQLVKHWNFKGTHGDSGKKVDVYGATLVKMKDGKILEEQDYWDARKFYKQLAD